MTDMFSMQPTMGVIVLVGFLSSLLVVCSAQEAPKVQLEVNFEMRCPDSSRFFLDQALPTYSQLQNIIELKLIPFGKARTSGTKLFCQHGPRECDLNRLVACVDSKSSNKLPVVLFIHCLFEGLSSHNVCLNRYLPALNYEDIDKCAKGQESFSMMQEFERITGRITYVPRIAVNGKWSSIVQEKAETSLKSYICEVYQGPKPEVCKKSTLDSTEG